MVRSPWRRSRRPCSRRQPSTTVGYSRPCAALPAPAASPPTTSATPPSSYRAAGGTRCSTPAVDLQQCRRAPAVLRRARRAHVVGGPSLGHRPVERSVAARRTARIRRSRHGRARSPRMDDDAATRAGRRAARRRGHGGDRPLLPAPRARAALDGARDRHPRHDTAPDRLGGGSPPRCRQCCSSCRGCARSIVPGGCR